MLEIMQFIFSSFWVWLGTMLMILCIGDALAGISLFKAIHRVVKKANKKSNQQR